MSTVTYRAPSVDPEVFSIIENNYYIDSHHLKVLSEKEIYLHQGASLSYIVEGYIECTLASRPQVFWYQLMHFPFSEQEWRVDIVPYYYDSAKMKELRDVEVNLVYGEPLPR